MLTIKKINAYAVCKFFVNIIIFILTFCFSFGVFSKNYILLDEYDHIITYVELLFFILYSLF